MDWREERDRYLRWLKNRETFDVNEFQSDLLTEHDKVQLAYKAIAGNRTNDAIPPLEQEDNPTADSPETVAASVSSGADYPEDVLRSQLDPGAEFEALSSQATAATAAKSTSNFLVNLVIAVLAVTLLVGVLLVVALLRAWLS